MLLLPVLCGTAGHRAPPRGLNNLVHKGETPLSWSFLEIRTLRTKLSPRCLPSPLLFVFCVVSEMAGIMEYVRKALGSAPEGARSMWWTTREVVDILNLPESGGGCAG